jgi:hypothetical protein
MARAAMLESTLECRMVVVAAGQAAEIVEVERGGAGSAAEGERTAAMESATPGPKSKSTVEPALSVTCR